MNDGQRSKRWLLLGAISSAAAVILWAAFVFTVMWLRVRCVRELSKQIQPLDEVGLYEHLNPEPGRPAVFDIFIHAIDGSRHSLARLEKLQQPTFKDVLHDLIGSWTIDGNDSDLRLTHTVAFSPDGRLIASTDSTNINIVWKAKSFTGLTGNLSWVAGADSSMCFEVIDSHGEKHLAVTKSVYESTADEPVQKQEIVLIDLSGRILDRMRVSERLLGKLSKPHGRADQIVFGTPGYVSLQDGSHKLRAVGPGRICIVENGKWKTIQTIDAMDSSDGHPPAHSSLEDSHD